MINLTRDKNYWEINQCKLILKFPPQPFIRIVKLQQRDDVFYSSLLCICHLSAIKILNRTNIEYYERCVVRLNTRWWVVLHHLVAFSLKWSMWEALVGKINVTSHHNALLTTDFYLFCFDQLTSHQSFICFLGSSDLFHVQLYVIIDIIYCGFIGCKTPCNVVLKSAI